MMKQPSRNISLKMLQVGWVLVGAIYFLFYTFSIQPMIDSYARDTGQVFGEALPQLGMTAQGYAAFFLILNLMLPITAALVAMVIFWKRRNDPMALFVSIALIMYSIVLGRPAIAITLAYPGSWWVVTLLRGMSAICILLLLCIFPNGRFVPRWSIVFLIVASPLMFYTSDIRHYLIPNVTTPVSLVSSLALLTALGFQIYRYLRHSTATERQQTKWVFYGIAIPILSIGIFVGVDILVTPIIATNQVVRLLYRFAVNTFLIFLPASFTPIAIGIAITRNRLWDIDLIINRSIVVAVASALLAFLFLVIVLVIRANFQNTFAGLPFIIAAVIAGALFDPTRRRVQQFLDRRFYRWRFDLNQLAAAEHGQSSARFGAWTGHLVDGYLIQSIIGKGGMGEVYRAVKDNHTYAIKTILKNAAPDQVERFKREATAMAQLQHHNIVRFFGAGAAPMPYIALEFIDGVNLGTLIAQRGRFSPHDALLILRGIAEGLDYAHNRGVIHRDLKPANILVKLLPDSNTVAPLLVDFGLAKISDGSTLTGTGAIGTIAYMAPEQIESAKEVTPKTDIYALGVILYEMLTGQQPFMGNPGQVLFAHLSQPPPDVRWLLPDLPAAFSAVIQQAMAKNAAERWPTAGAMATALETSLQPG